MEDFFGHKITNFVIDLPSVSKMLKYLCKSIFSCVQVFIPDMLCLADMGLIALDLLNTEVALD